MCWPAPDLQQCRWPAADGLCIADAGCLLCAGARTRAKASAVRGCCCGACHRSFSLITSPIELNQSKNIYFQTQQASRSSRSRGQRIVVQAKKDERPGDTPDFWENEQIGLLFQVLLFFGCGCPLHEILFCGVAELVVW